jgi:hypothetical protein
VANGHAIYLWTIPPKRSPGPGGTTPDARGGR